MAQKGFRVKLIFLLHLMGVSHLCCSALTDSWCLMGGGRRGGGVVFNSSIWRTSQPVTLAMNAIYLRPRLAPEQLLTAVVMSWLVVLGSGLPRRGLGVLSTESLLAQLSVSSEFTETRVWQPFVLRFQDFSLPRLLGNKMHDVSDARVWILILSCSLFSSYFLIAQPCSFLCFNWIPGWPAYYSSVHDNG